MKDWLKAIKAAVLALMNGQQVRSKVTPPTSSVTSGMQVAAPTHIAVTVIVAVAARAATQY